MNQYYKPHAYSATTGELETYHFELFSVLTLLFDVVYICMYLHTILTQNNDLCIRTLQKCLTLAVSLFSDIQMLSTGTAVTRQQQTPPSAPLEVRLSE
jgi:hypothetical protein